MPIDVRRLKTIYCDAGFSACNRYRYWLTRIWVPALPGVCWVMLNPSTADAERDDPTIRRCVRFSRRWGFGGLVVVNLFAWRAKRPAELSAIDDPVGEDNDASLLEHAGGRTVIAAWGNHGALLGRAKTVLQLLAGSRIRCLGVTAAGQPRHPLYVAGDSATLPVQVASGLHLSVAWGSPVSTRTHENRKPD
jgi:hypothetical protein